MALYHRFVSQEPQLRTIYKTTPAFEGAEVKRPTSQGEAPEAMDELREERRAVARLLDAAMEAIRAWPEAYQAAVNAMGVIFDEYHPHLSSA